MHAGQYGIRPAKFATTERVLRLYSASKKLDVRSVTRGGREPAVTREERSAEFLGKHDVSSIIGRKIMAELPDAREQNDMGIPRDPQVQEVTDRLIAPPLR